MSVESVKRKLCFHCGTPPSSQVLLGGGDAHSKGWEPGKARQVSLFPPSPLRSDRAI